MAGEITIDVLCSDIESLGANEAEARMFVNDYIAPAVLSEIISRRQVYFDGFDSAQQLNHSPELQARGCKVTGTIFIKF